MFFGRNSKSFMKNKEIREKKINPGSFLIFFYSIKAFYRRRLSVVSSFVKKTIINTNIIVHLFILHCLIKHVINIFK